MNKKLWNQRAYRHFQVLAKKLKRERLSIRAKREGNTWKIKQRSDICKTRKKLSAFENFEDWSVRIIINLWVYFIN